jgi:hypothetical protein
MSLGISNKEKIVMSSSPPMAADTPKPAQAPETPSVAKPAPQQNQDNKQADGKPAQQQQK